MRVTISSILDYAAGKTELISEGERLYKANHLLLVGARITHEDGVTIFAACLRSSCPKSEPHKISIRTKPHYCDWRFACTCGAGAVACKHVMAVLNYLLITPTIPKLSAADLKQEWVKIAEKVVDDMHKAVPLADFCITEQVKKRENVSVTEEESALILQMFLNCGDVENFLTA